MQGTKHLKIILDKLCHPHIVHMLRCHMNSCMVLVAGLN